MHARLLTMALAALLFSSLGCQAAEVTLVREGKPVATLLLAENPTLGAQLAAFELQHFVQQMTGAELPIVREPAQVAGPRVLVAESEATRALGLDPSKFEHQEHLLRTVGEDLVLIGKDKPAFGEYKYGTAWFSYGHGGLFDSDELGTPYAVYTLLEKLGVRWYWPGDLGTVIPRSQNLTVPALDLQVRPYMFACRFNGYNPRPLSQPWINVFRPETLGKVAPTPEDVGLDQLRFLESSWRVRNQGGRGELASGHSQLLRSYIKRSAETHPEWWGTNKPVFGSQMCLTNPALVDQVVQDIIDVMTGKEDRIAPTLEGLHLMRWKREVEARTVALGMEDTNKFCQCDRCKAMYDPFDENKYKMGFSCGTQSRYVWTFVSQVARRVQAVVPDVKISCLAYWVYFYPPEGVEIPDNVESIPCLHWPYHHDPVIRDYERHVVEGWGKLTPNRVVTYAYYLFPAYSAVLANQAKRAQIPTWNLSFFAPRLIADNLKHAVQHGTRGFTAELNSWPVGSGAHANVIWDHLNMYMTWKLSQDPTLDPDAILQEYYHLFYGPAEVPMGRFWDGLEELYMSPQHADEVWTAQRVLQLGEYLQQARALLPDETSAYRRRVEMVRQGVFNTLDDSRQLRSWPVTHDFEDRSLLGFVDLGGHMPPPTDHASVVSEDVDGQLNHFLAVPGYFNVMRTLPVPVKVEGDLATVEIKLRVRCHGASPVGVYLTSLSQPEGGAGGYAKGEKDVAFGLQGYQYGNDSNQISYFQDGKSVSKTERTRLLSAADAWHTVRLLFDRGAGSLTAWVDDNPRPYLEQTGVRLEGAAFQGLWLRGHGSAYDDISVTSTKKAD